jgi:hypothetical protein
MRKCREVMACFYGLFYGLFAGSGMLRRQR